MGRKFVIASKTLTTTSSTPLLAAHDNAVTPRAFFAMIIPVICSKSKVPVWLWEMGKSKVNEAR